jgi:hypothetical protein
MDTEHKNIPDTVVEGHYVEVQHQAIEFLVAQLIDFRKVFAGDLDEMLIFLLLARYHLREEIIETPSDVEYFPVHSLSLARLSDITEIPRETVRRKLIAMQKRGLVEKDEQDKWRISVRHGSPVIRTEYAEYWQREMKRLVKLVKAISPYV